MFNSRAITALITPYKNYRIDFSGVQNLMAWQYEQGIRSFVIAGCTGESSCLTYEERCKLAEVAVEFSQGLPDLQIILGINSSSTDEAVLIAQKAEMIGVDGVMVMAPAYNKPLPKGLYRHFKAINDGVNLPIIIYNSPSRSGINISDEVIAELAKLPNIRAVKDSTGDLERPLKLRQLLADGVEFDMVAADDIMAVAFNANGGVGCISVASNIIPAMVKEVQDLTASGSFYEALIVQQKLVDLYGALFCETNPVPIKYAAYLLGKISSPEVRLPLVELEESSKTRIEKALTQLGLL